MDLNCVYSHHFSRSSLDDGFNIDPEGTLPSSLQQNMRQAVHLLNGLHIFFDICSSEY